MYHIQHYKSMKNLLSGCYDFMKEHPGWTFGILAALIVAGVFSGGMIFAAPAVFAGFAIAGAVVAGIATAVTGFAIGKACEPSPFVDSDDRLQFPQSNTPGLIMLLGLVGAFAVGLFVASAPIAGVVFCGLALVAAAGALFGFLAKTIKNSYCTKPEDQQPPPPRPRPADLHRSEPSLNHGPKLTASSTHAMATAGFDIKTQATSPKHLESTPLLSTSTVTQPLPYTPVASIATPSSERNGMVFSS